MVLNIFFVICKNCLTIFNKHFRPCRFYIRIKFVKFEHQSIFFCLVSLRKMCNFYDWLINGLISVWNYLFGILQGYNARKVISEVYASFVLQCSPCHGIYLLHKKSMKYSGHRKLLCELSNF